MCWLYIQNCDIVINIRTSWKIMPIISCYWLDKKKLQEKKVLHHLSYEEMLHSIKLKNQSCHCVYSCQTRGQSDGISFY